MPSANVTLLCYVQVSSISHHLCNARRELSGYHPFAGNRRITVAGEECRKIKLSVLRGHLTGLSVATPNQDLQEAVHDNYTVVHFPHMKFGSTDPDGVAALMNNTRLELEKVSRLALQNGRCAAVIWASDRVNGSRVLAVSVHLLRESRADDLMCLSQFFETCFYSHWIIWGGDFNTGVSPRSNDTYSACIYQCYLTFSSGITFL